MALSDPCVMIGEMAANPKDRLHYAALLLLEYAGGSMQRTNLNKALFYLDLLWLRDTGETFTGEEYVAIRHGPVVRDYPSRLIQSMLAHRLVSEEEVRLNSWMVAKPLTLVVHPEPPEDEHLELLARQVADFMSNLAAVDVSEMSHSNLGWKLAYEAGEGQAIDMVVALDQVAGDDAWLDEGVSSDERALVDERLAGEFIPMPDDLTET